MNTLKKKTLRLIYYKDKKIKKTGKNCFSEMVWYFIGVYIINRTLHGRLLKIFHSFAALTREIFFNTRREISYLRAAM